MSNSDDKRYMEFALDEAQKAFEIEEVPIGAVVIYENEVIGSGYNLRESENDPTAHAEIIALREAATSLSSWRLADCTLYVTIEPCPMCAGALLQARVDRVVYGADDPKAGAVNSLYNFLDDVRFNHQVEVKKGVLVEECRGIIKKFFQRLRKN